MTDLQLALKAILRLSKQKYPVPGLENNDGETDDLHDNFKILCPNTKDNYKIIKYSPKNNEF